MSAPLATCGLPALDRGLVTEAAGRYARMVHHADHPDALQSLFNGTAPAVIYTLARAAGFDLAAACTDWRARYPNAAIVCCAQNDEFDTKLEALDAGADQFLVTPIEEEALEFILRFCLVEQDR